MDEENSIDRQLEAKAEKLAPVLRTNDLMFQQSKLAMFEKIEALMIENKRTQKATIMCEYDILTLQEIPEEFKKLSYLPTLKKKLKDQERKLAVARANYEQTQDEARKFLSQKYNQ